MPTATELRKSHLAMLAARQKPELNNDVTKVVSFAESVLQDYAPSKDYAYAYAMLGAVVSNHMKQAGLSYVQIAPSVLSKAFRGKDRKLGSVVRGLMTPDSDQFKWMSAVLCETFSLGVIVTIDDTLLFVDLAAAAVKDQDRMRVIDVEKAFSAVTTN